MRMKKTKLTNVVLLLLIVAWFMAPSGSFAREHVKLKADPAETAERMINNPALKNKDGELFCWYAVNGMQVFAENYEVTKNTAWLDAGIKYYDYCISKMETDPDGYKGWIGEYGYDSKYDQDALIGDAIMFEAMLDFSVIVLENKDLKKKYGEKANEIVRLAAHDLIEKNDKRGCWIEDGPYGGYVGFNKYLAKDNHKIWIYGPKVDRSGLSHPFNKQEVVGTVCLKLWRITGNKFYRDRAERIFFTAKSHLQYFNDHYGWNYFEPLYPLDVNVKRNNTLHFVDVHPHTGYQAVEVKKIVEAYHYGIVFDEQDIKRIINTNLKVMWNGDKVNPKWVSSSGLGSGELWTGLLDFDQTVRDLYELRFKDDKMSDEYLRYKNTVLVNPPSFKRKFVKGKVTVPKVDFTECKDLNCAVVLPHEIKKDSSAVIICKSRVAGNLLVDVYSKDNKKLLNLYTGPIREWFYTTTWNGKDPSGKLTFKGEYKIRWTTAGGYREFPVIVD